MGIVEAFLSVKKLQGPCSLVFASWGFCITDERTVHLYRNGFTREVKGYLDKERKRTERKQWSPFLRVAWFLMRLIATPVVVVCILIYSMIWWLAYVMAQFRRNDGILFLLNFVPTFAITVLSSLLPAVFSCLIILENYTTPFRILITVCRTVSLRFAPILMLLFYLRGIIHCAQGEQDVCFEGRGSNCRRPICWETAVGQEIYKLVLMDFVAGIASVYCIEPYRRRKVDSTNSRIIKWIGRPKFCITTKVLDLACSQTLCWIGTFYCPILPAISSLKYFIIFYAQKHSLMNNSKPLYTSHHVTLSNTYLMIVLTVALFLAVVSLGYALVEIPPSVSCGPFRHIGSIWGLMMDTVRSWSWPLNKFVSFLISMFYTLPTVVILLICIHYYSLLSAGRQRMKKRLKDKLLLECKDSQFLQARIIEVARQQVASDR